MKTQIQECTIDSNVDLKDLNMDNKDQEDSVSEELDKEDVQKIKAISWIVNNLKL